MQQVIQPDIPKTREVKIHFQKSAIVLKLLTFTGETISALCTLYPVAPISLCRIHRGIGGIYQFLGCIDGGVGNARYPLSAPPCRCVNPPDIAAYHVSDILEHSVARLVAEPVVGLLEEVNVYHQARKGRVVPVSGLYLFCNEGLDMPPVKQPRKGIRDGEGLAPGEKFFELGVLFPEFVLKRLPDCDLAVLGNDNVISALLKKALYGLCLGLAVLYKKYVCLANLNILPQPISVFTTAPPTMRRTGPTRGETPKMREFFRLSADAA